MLHLAYSTPSSDRDRDRDRESVAVGGLSQGISNSDGIAAGIETPQVPLVLGLEEDG